MAGTWKIRRGTVPKLSDEPLSEALGVLDKSAAELYATQPNLRTVVDFLARHVAHLGLHVFERDEDDSRNRVRDHPVARLLAAPNATQTTYEFMAELVSAMALYDRALVWCTPDSNGDPAELQVIPESWIVDTEGSDPFEVGAYVLEPEDGNRITVKSDDVIVFHGWNPTDKRIGLSPIVALRGVLYEQMSAAEYRRQQWDNGGRIGSYLTRPATAPKWTNEGRTRFKKGWQSAYAGSGKKIGGVPVLEDGMELKTVRFNAKEEDYVEGAKLALTTVASAYHINPTMLGQLDNANYSNVVEFRKGLYGDTLGPFLAMIEARFNRFLVGRFRDADNVYVEFNIREKLEGDFADQMDQYAAGVQAGIYTVNEVRKRLNMPATDGGEVLRTPLNMAPANEGARNGETD